MRHAFGAAATVNSLLLRTVDGVDRAQLARRLQGEFLANGLVVTDIPADVRNTYAANTQMFRLMQGYLALGLLVAIIGLGVVMVRRCASAGARSACCGRWGSGPGRSDVRSSPRAPWSRSRASSWGRPSGILTTYLLYRNSPAFGSVDSGFPIAWPEIALTVGTALVASLAATVVPARRAAAIRPAVAVRVAD